MGHVQAVGPREFLNNQQQPNIVFNNPITDHRLMIDSDPGDVLHQDGRAVLLDLEDHILHWSGIDLVVLIKDRQHVADAEPLFVCFDPATSPDVVFRRTGIQANLQSITGGLQDVVKCHIVFLQFVRNRLDT